MFVISVYCLVVHTQLSPLPSDFPLQSKDNEIEHPIVSPLCHPLLLVKTTFSSHSSLSYSLPFLPTHFLLTLTT